MPFQIAVVSDEISQDFGYACEVASQKFGVGWIELRSLWDKNILGLNSSEIAEALRLIRKNDLRVIGIASPLFKVDWPDAPRSRFGQKRDQFNANFTYAQQEEVLERSLALARTFATSRVRCFDFWRLDDPSPYRQFIDETLQAAADKAGKHGISLAIENEAVCNTATAAEAARVLAAVRSPHFVLNWDPGNAAICGETPYPDGYHLLPKERIGHCHCKDVIKKGSDYEWAAVGQGIIDWVGQFIALQQDGYRGAISLETHWRGAGTADASTVESWKGMQAALQKAGAV